MQKYSLGLFISIVAVSFASIFILSCQAPPLSIAFYRLLFTTILLLPVLLIRKKTRDEIRSLPRMTLLIMIVIGVILAAHFSLWITSLKMTSVASSVILVTAHPVLVAPVSFYFLKEKLSWINALGIAISLAGVGVLVIGNYGFSAFGLDTIEGNILALLGGVAAGLYILGGRKLRKTVSTVSYAFVVYTVGAITLFFICLSFDAPIINLAISDYSIILLMALVSGIFGHTLYNWSLGHIRASVMSVALLGEPIGSTFLAFVIPQIILVPWVAQIPSAFTIIGGTIILLGIYLTARTVKETDLLENV
ncbi:MAG TPA: EamA/RhaT family transporter [Thermoplasmata archaeon]|jgi:drug/metabolite transporter (DMT)-like permease|nr:MAG TPA: EamA/RhaT family transporter [Thermoplasmata archaeon]